MSASRKYAVTPQEIVRTLCSIENWIKGVRKVIAQMDPNMQIVLSDHLPNYADTSDSMPMVKGCPPPDVHTDENGVPIDVRGCPPPDWYQEKCP